MTSAAAILILSTLALFGGIAAVICAILSSSELRSHESAEDRAYRWREEMRKKTHDRQYR